MPAKLYGRDIGPLDRKSKHGIGANPSEEGLPAHGSGEKFNAPRRCMSAIIVQGLHWDMRAHRGQALLTFLDEIQRANLPQSEKEI